MKIKVVLCINHTSPLVYLNHQDMCSDSSHPNYFKLTKTSKTWNGSALLLYNAYTLLSMEICVTNNYKLKIHPNGIATFKKPVLWWYSPRTLCQKMRGGNRMKVTKNKKILFTNTNTLINLLFIGCTPSPSPSTRGKSQRHSMCCGSHGQQCKFAAC